MRVTTMRMPSLSARSSTGASSSSRSTLTPASRTRSATVAAVLVRLALAVLGHEGDLLGSGDGDVHAVTADVVAAAGRQVRAGEALADLVEGRGHGGGGHPVLRLVAVDAQRQLTREPHRDLGAVVDGLVGGGQHDVAVGELDALAGEDVTDVVAERVDLGLLAVEGQGHGLAHRRVGDGPPDQRQDDREVRGDDQHSFSHGSPGGVDSGKGHTPEAASRSTITTWSRGDQIGT